MSLIDSIIGAESGGDPNAANPGSSASGLGQFTNSTFLDVIRQARPDLAGQSDSDLLTLKNDPTIGRQVTQAYADQNQAILQKNGLPVTDGNTYLAHFAGPGGAVKVLQADPNAQVSDILGPGVVKANPFLAGMTAQGLQAWAAKKMGATSPLQQSASASPAAPANAAPAAPMQAPNPASSSQAGMPSTPYFAPPPQQQAQAAPGGGQMPGSPPQAPPIYFAPRKPIDLSALKASFGAPSFFKGQA